jgi:hypothetical protein
MLHPPIARADARLRDFMHAQTHRRARIPNTGLRWAERAWRVKAQAGRSL